MTEPQLPSRQPVKILHVVDTFELGGAEIHCLRLAQAVDAHKFAVHVASFGGVESERFGLECGLPWLRIQKKAHRIASFRSLLSVWRILRYIRRNNIRLVHTYLYRTHLLAAIAAKLGGARLVEHIHDYRYEDRSIATKQWYVHMNHYRFVAFFSNFSDAIVVLTPSCLASVRRAVRRSGNLFALIPNGVLDSRLRANSSTFRREHGLPDQAPLFVVACRLTATKNVGLAILAFALARRTVHSVELVIAGEGPERPLLESLAADLKICESVHFLGRLHNMDELLSEGIALLHPSLVELNSLAILEAMTFGIAPVALGTVSGNAMLISDMNDGILVPSTKAEDWANAIVTLATDQVLCRRLGSAAKSSALRRFSMDRHVAALEKVYGSVLAER